MGAGALTRAARALLAVFGALMLAAGAWWLAGGEGTGGVSRAIGLAYAALMLGDGAVTLALAWALPRLPEWGVWLAAGLVGANVVFTVVDEVGAADTAVLGVEAVALGLLIALALHRRAGTA